MRRNTIIWMFGLGAIALVSALLTLITPVRLTVALGSDTPEAAAHGAVALDLPTTTPQPPTAVPPTAIPPTAVLPTAVPPTVTPEPPREERTRTTPTSAPLTPTAVPATPEPEPPSQIAIEKRASVATALPGDRLSYTLVVTNHGQGTAHDVIVTDEVPPPLVVVDLASSKGDIVVEGRKVTAYPGTLAPGETQTYTIVVELPAQARPGALANTAVVTTTTIGDDPGDNTTTTTIEIVTARAKQTDPPRLPKTADPFDPADQAFLAIYWPLLALACGLFAFGAATHLGVFRQRTMRVMVGAVPAAADAVERAELGGFAINIQLDPHELVARWRAGASTRDLVALVEQRNPQVDRLAVSIAVQRVLQAEIRQG